MPTLYHIENFQIIYYVGIILQICGAMKFSSFSARSLTLKKSFNHSNSYSGGIDNPKQELSLEGDYIWRASGKE